MTATAAKKKAPVKEDVEEVQVEAPERKPKVLVSGRFSEEEYAFARLSALVPADVDFDDIMQPGFWSNNLGPLKRNLATNQQDRSGAIITVRTDDHAFLAQLYVRAVLESGLIVQCVGPCFDPKNGKACPVDLQTGLPYRGRPDANSKQFEVRWNQGKKGFDVVSKVSNQVVADGHNLKTREQAIEWIKKIERL